MNNSKKPEWWRPAPLFSASSPVKGFARAAAIGWTALVFYACFMPSSGVPRFPFPYADKWVHGLLFFGFAVLWAFAFPAGGNRMLQIVVAAGMGLGYGIEVLQGVIPALGRSYDSWDIMADSIGAFAGALCWKWGQIRAKGG